MADKLTPAFTNVSDCQSSRPEGDHKKKVYSITLPSVEAYAKFIETMKSHTFHMWTDGYASTAYTMIRYIGGEVSAASDKASASAKLAAKDAEIAEAKEAARLAAAEAASTKQMFADMQRQIEEMRAAQAASAAQNGTTETAGGKSRKGRMD